MACPCWEVLHSQEIASCCLPSATSLLFLKEKYLCREVLEVFGQWWILSCAFLTFISFELSFIATYKSFPLVSFFLLRGWYLFSRVGKGTSSCEDIPYVPLFTITAHFQNALFPFHSLILVKINITGHPENYPYFHVLCYLLLPHQKCVAHHVAPAAPFFKQEVKSDSSVAGHRTTGCQSGRDLPSRRLDLPYQSPAQSRVRCEARPG